MNPQPQKPPAPSSSEESFSLADLFNLLHGGRRTLLGATTCALLLGGIYLLLAKPVYEVDALVQIESRKAGKGGEALAAMTSGLFEAATEAQAELEILTSTLVLGRTAEALKLDLTAKPRWRNPFGAAWLQGKPDGRRIEVEAFELATGLRGETFLIRTQEGGSFTWEAPDGSLLAKGRVGERITARYLEQDLSLQLRALAAKPGTTFILKREPIQLVVETLREHFTLAERGKQTNIIGLSLEDTDPAKGVTILNTILDQYIYQNIERKAEEASKTLVFLEQQLPILRGKREAAERLLNQCRAEVGSIDLDQEALALLTQGAALDTEITALRQKRVAALLNFEERSGVVVNLDQQIAALLAESRKVAVQTRRWPVEQQKVMSLMRESQVNQDLYTALLNNIQQLQITRAGETGNARIVDHASPKLLPVKPQWPLVLLLASISGLLVGFGLLLTKRALHPGLEDPQALEAQFGLPVLVAVSHSNGQDALIRSQKRGMDLPGVLATDQPEDLAIESLRSLRTSLHFMLLDAPVKSIMVAGPAPGIGKSFVSANLAIVLGQGGSRVLLVDADLRRGHLHDYFPGLGREPGLTNILTGGIAWQAATHQSQGIDVIPSGTILANAAEMLMNERFVVFLREAEKAYDYVLIDVPPVLAVTDAAIIGGKVGTVLLVLKAGMHTTGEIHNTLRRLDSAGIYPRGVIFNDVKNSGSAYGSYKYSYNYNYKANNK